MFKCLVILPVLVYVISAGDAPIIGILSQETFIISKIFPGEHHDSYIAASYVKYLESAGARVIPVWIGQSESYYRRVVSYTNGILFPGGGTYFNETGGYADAAKHIYRLAVDANKNGVYYPIWGTCMGMQVLPFAALGEDIRVDCLLRHKSLPLNFTEGYKKSKLFANASSAILNSMKFRNLTYNNHRFCLTYEVLKKNGLLPDWKILATNIDARNFEFISVMESIDYPIYATQFHPEKNQFEFKFRGVSHILEAVKVSQYFADFFVEECRKNNNIFPSREIADKAFIYNYSPRYTGSRNSSYEQIYLFNETEFKRSPLDSYF